MSSERDNPIARWSRRKLNARTSGDAPSPGKELASNVRAGDVAAASPDPIVVETDPSELEAPEVTEPLPRLEDLTVESDLAAFLRKEVPKALRHAAMRKMWSLDPGIRDYVGPSEYAWDFNEPGSMSGFGPLDAKETVVGFLSKAARTLEGVTQEDQPTSTQVLPVEAHPETSVEKAPSPSKRQALAGIEPLSKEQVGDVDRDSSQATPEPPAAQAPSRKEPGSFPRADGYALSRHGGALPR